MTEIVTARLRDQLSRTIGPTPWYWKSFPSVTSASGKKFVWTHRGEQGPLGYLVALGPEQEPDKPLLALNTYCRSFSVPGSRLGVWCPEGRHIRLVCFDPDQLAAFDVAGLAGWFKQSSERMYSATSPIADFEVPLALSPGMHKVEVPEQLRGVDELIVPTSYPAKSVDDPAFALYVFYLQAGLVEVLPQKWFTASQYEVGKQWIPRAARDPGSHRIFGECFGVGTFLLEEDGCRLDRWLEKINH
jgi:hypothetical protein